MEKMYFMMLKYFDRFTGLPLFTQNLQSRMNGNFHTPKNGEDVNFSVQTSEAVP